MTVEPASTRANRINSDSLDWSYIEISFRIGNSTSARRARGRSTTHSPSTRTDGGRRPALRCSLRAMDLGPAAGLLKTKARIARKHGSWIAVTNAANEVRPNPRAREERLIHAGVVE